ncbi:MAG: GNAT family N-acetyltransferase [Hamadaea sp.]|nr:GNAT family N-acetyltransferase [Hamadaea sp.]
MTPPTTPQALAAAADAAVADADNAAARAGVRVAELHDLPSLEAAGELLCQVWGADSPDQLVNLSLLRALAHAGNYVAGAHREDKLIAVAVAFLGEGHLHSHITGVTRGGQGAGVGHVLKLHQRGWALRRGIPEVRWTFDPLVRRNAYFNLQKLGATASDYLVDFYGPLTDGINVGDPSDRLLAVWDLAGDRAVRAIAGTLPAADATTAARTVQIPEDIEALRPADPAAALRWRHAVREGLLSGFAEGLVITGVTRDGRYVLNPGRDDA